MGGFRVRQLDHIISFLHKIHNDLQQMSWVAKKLKKGKILTTVSSFLSFLPP